MINPPLHVTMNFIFSYVETNTSLHHYSATCTHCMCCLTVLIIPGYITDAGDSMLKLLFTVK